MKEKTKEKIVNTLRIVILSLILSTAIGYSLADWAPPTGAPPLGNTPPPINVGSATQEKTGNLILGQWLIAGKARTQPTVGATGCVPSSSTDPTCDSAVTLTTKDYVDQGLIRSYVSFQNGALGFYNPSSARQLNTTYTNTSGHEIMVVAWTYSGCIPGDGPGYGSCDSSVDPFYYNPTPLHCAIQILVDGVQASSEFKNTPAGLNSMCQGVAVVSKGSTYRVATGWADIKLFGWSEFR